AASEVLGRPVQVRFAIDPELFQKSRRAQEQRGSANGACQPPGSESSGGAITDLAPRGLKIEDRATRTLNLGLAQEASISARSSILDPRVRSGPVQPPDSRSLPKRARRWRRLNEFAVGPCNRVAHASALSVIEDPGQGANPLVFHGPVGTGKTHLLEGIYVGL